MDSLSRVVEDTGPPEPPSTPATVGAIALVAAIVGVGYGVPFFGPLISFTVPMITHGFRRQLWGAVSRPTSLRSSILAWVGLWLPGFLSLVTQPFYPINLNSSTGWLITRDC